VPVRSASARRRRSPRRFVGKHCRGDV
jgi:hypothetical protein